jgi:hydroxymethylpyrimidine/phosphomethylpyrimidine kinase
MQPPPVVLTIAGFDPSSGAGVTADVKTFAAHGCYGLACITAVTVQSTRGVKRVEPLSPRLVTETLAELQGDFEISAVKIGMLGAAANARAVLRFLQKHRPEHVVLDPVLRSSRGARLLESAGLEVVRKMLRLVEVTTPNAAEAAALSGMRIRTMEQLRRAAMRLHEYGAKNVVITGGDFEPIPGKAIDVFSTAHGEFVEFCGRKICSTSTHGTGCAFSSALAANLARGYKLADAISLAKQFVASAIESAAPLGHGRGPLNLNASSTLR